MIRLFFESLIGGYWADARYLAKTILAGWR